MATFPFARKHAPRRHADHGRWTPPEQHPRTEPKSGNSVEDNWMPPIGPWIRIEVVRGPMSSRYGSDAMGGVVNIITRKVCRGMVRLGQGRITDAAGQFPCGNAYLGNFYLTGRSCPNFLASGRRDTRPPATGTRFRAASAGDNLNGTARLWFTPTPDTTSVRGAQGHQRY